MEDNIQKLASMGRFEDDQIAHVATGEMIVPPVISPVTRMMIEEDMLNQGMDPNQYIVGGNPSINPRTGLQEFFIKKLFKKIKKVLPVAVSFIPGIGPVAKGVLTAVAGKASGMDTKDALLGGLTAGLGAKFAAGKAGATGVAGEAAKTGRFSRLRNFFNPAEGAKGLAGGTFGPNIRRGIGNIFSGGLGGGQQEVMYQDQFGNVISAEEYAAMSDVDKPMYDEVRNPNILRQVLGSTPGQSGIGVIEDLIKGRESDFTKPRGQQLFNADGQPVSSQGFGLGGAGGLAALAALYGLATK